MHHKKAIDRQERLGSDWVTELQDMGSGRVMGQKS